jgi:PAS domain S-box-containing protein
MSGGGPDSSAELERLRSENERLRTRLEQQLGAHRELARGLGSTHQLGSILRTSLEHAIALAGGDSGAVYLIAEREPRLELAAHLGLGPAYVHARGGMSLDDPWVVLTAQGVIRFLDRAEHLDTLDEHDRAEGLLSAVIIPVFQGERLLGALQVGSRRLEALDPRSTDALDLVARLLGAAVARSRAQGQQALLARVVEESIAGIGVAELDGTAVYVNPALVHMWGYESPSAPLGGSVLDWWADRLAAERILARVMAERSVTDELLARRADGSCFPVIGTASLVTDEDGSPTHVVGSFVDTTGLREAERLERDVRVTATINGLLSRTVEGEDERGLGCACARAAMSLSGAQLGLLGLLDPDGALEAGFAVGEGLAEAQGETMLDGAPFGQGPLRGLWAIAAGRREPLIVNQLEAHPVRVGLPDGHLPVDNVMFVPVYSEGRSAALLVMGNRPGGFSARERDDVLALVPAVAQVIEHRRSERARLEGERRLLDQEAMLRQSQKLEAIGRLAGGVAHDFNNLLAVVTLYGQSLLAGLEPGSELAEDAEAIVETAERGASLTRQLLAFGRRAVLQPVRQQAGAFVLEMEEMLRRLLGADIELVVDAEPDAGWIHADPGEMGQVLMNLAVNARDAMPRGGRLVVSVLDSVELDGTLYSELPAGRYVELRVEDTGVGMSSDQLERIFEPFYTTKEQGKGTGLGLATVYGIVRQSGGSVRVQSQPGAGTCFHIYLPQVASSQRASTPQAREAGLAGGQETVLLSEDAPHVRRGTARILRSAGYRVLEAANAGEALLIAEQHVGPIHSLLTDVDMPRIDGPSLARRLLLARPLLKVLYVSGHGGERLARLRPELDEARLLFKPFGAQQLTEALRGLLDSA